MPSLALHRPQEAPQTTAGLLLSLAHTLPRSMPLARQATRMAHALGRYNRPPRALALAAADLLASLLDETDDRADELQADGLLDGGFDE